MLRYLTAGESHGRARVVVVEGMPAGLLVTAEDIQRGLARRRLGFGRGPRMRFEADEVSLVGGIRHGRTLGSPIAIEIGNTEWPKWEEEMSPAPGLPSKVLTQPRPGHADLAGMLKYGLDDARDVLERASARETAARVAAGTLAKLLLSQIGIDVLSHIVQLGPEEAGHGPLPTLADLARIDESPVRSADPEAEARSRTSRASSSPYLSMPARSAWPGRGWVRTLEGRPGAGDISSSHFGHSVLAISMAIGDPRVRPWRMPPTRLTSSTSKRIRGPRPKPSRRRASPRWMSSAVTRRPAGTPSRITTRARPWDSPAVR